MSRLLTNFELIPTNTRISVARPVPIAEVSNRYGQARASATPLTLFTSVSFWENPEDPGAWGVADNRPEHKFSMKLRHYRRCGL